MANDKNCTRYLAELHQFDSYADREKLVKEWLCGEAESDTMAEVIYGVLFSYFDALYRNKDPKAQAVHAYFYELMGAEDLDLNDNAREATPSKPMAERGGSVDINYHNAVVVNLNKMIERLRRDVARQGEGLLRCDEEIKRLRNVVKKQLEAALRQGENMTALINLLAHQKTAKQSNEDK